MISLRESIKITELDTSGYLKTNLKNKKGKVLTRRTPETILEDILKTYNDPDPKETDGKRRIKQFAESVGGIDKNVNDLKAMRKIKSEVASALKKVNETSPQNESLTAINDMAEKNEQINMQIITYKLLGGYEIISVRELQKYDRQKGF
jgi:hypothetical protein